MVTPYCPEVFTYRERSQPPEELHLGVYTTLTHAKAALAIARADIAQGTFTTPREEKRLSELQQKPPNERPPATGTRWMTSTETSRNTNTLED
ncbi:hypothetical protein J2S67_000244 [Pseudoglutamicibacter albus]|uniref:Uncharacterized protein n=1 Tax=Pseudoglutamicibacter albus TaxID=98671 RepID=A0ABU1YX88_9MICC|nr:hypothetical protein [Pseudoglutamicibacter albus]